MQLPPEILEVVFESLDKSTLSNVRLACKSFEKSATPFLFDQIYISNIKADLEIAKLTVLRFGHYARTLVLASDYHYSRFAHHQIKRWLEEESENDSLLREKKCLQQHIDDARHHYNERWAEWKDVEESGELLGHLSFILPRMPRLRTVQLAAFPLFRYASGEQFQSLDSDFPCPHRCSDPTCVLREKLLSLKPNSGDTLSLHRWPLATGAWRSLIRALAVTKVCAKELISDDSGDLLPISCGVFEMSQTEAFDFRESVKDLVKLRLHLIKDDDDSHENVFRALAAATNLEQLELDFAAFEWPLEEDMPSLENMGLLENISGGCRFPKLKSLKLSSFWLTEDQLVELLRSLPSLETLQLYDCHLTQGSWEQVARQIKTSLRLLKVKFENLWGGVPGTIDEYDPPMIARPDMEDFILRNGDNPFTNAVPE